MKKIWFSSNEFLPLMNMFNSLWKYIESQNGEINIFYNNLFDLIVKNQNIDVESDTYWILEVNMRITHFFLFDYEPSLLWKIKIDKNFKEAMEQNILSIFEVMEYWDLWKYVILKDLINDTELKIEWEFAGSDFSLNDLELWRIVASRLIKYDSKWFLLKNYYYYENDDNINNIIAVFKQKTINLYDLELAINYILFWAWEEISNINYYKRLINVLKKYLTKKELKIATSFLKNFNKDKCLEFIKYLFNLDKKEKFYKEFSEALWSYMMYSGFTEFEMNNVYWNIISYWYKLLFNQLKWKSIDYKTEKFDIFFENSMAGFFENNDMRIETYNKILSDIIDEDYSEIEFS